MVAARKRRLDGNAGNEDRFISAYNVQQIGTARRLRNKLTERVALTELVNRQLMPTDRRPAKIPVDVRAVEVTQNECRPITIYVMTHYIA